MGFFKTWHLAFGTIFLIVQFHPPLVTLRTLTSTHLNLREAGASEQSTETATPRKYTGPKRRLAILPIQGSVSYSTGEKAAEILKASLAESGEFEVRSGAAGGADHLIRVTLTETQQFESGGAGALGGAAQGLQTGHWLGGLLGAIIGGALTFRPAKVSATVELVDAKTEKSLNSVSFSGEGGSIPSSANPEEAGTPPPETKPGPAAVTLTTPMDVAIKDALDKAVEWLTVHTPFTIHGPGSFVEFVSQENIFERAGGGAVIASVRQTERARVVEIAEAHVKVGLRDGQEGWAYKESLRPSNTDESFPPTISLTAPLDEKEYFKPAIEVSGIVWASRPINSVTVNDKRVEISQGRFVVDRFPLNPGVNSVTIKATDELGRAAIKNVKVTRSKDTVPPALLLTSHRDNSIVTTPTIDLLGEAKDNGGVAWVRVNGQEASKAGETFRVLDFPLSLGENSIKIIAADEAGNQSEAFTVTVIRKRDTKAPTIVLASPVENVELRAESVTVSGNVSDDGDIGSVTVNGQPVSLTGGKFTVERFPLHVGANPITIKAADKTGNESSQKVIVVRIVGGSADRKALSLQDVEGLLKDIGSPRRVATLTEEHGIKFEVTEEAKSRLRRGGADNDLIQSLENLFLRGR